MKRLLNRTEEMTNDVLRPLAEKWGARSFPKVRVADVLEIENSGINDEQYGFALQSHFDFIVTAENHFPVFAVEFDGDSHATDVQRRRDKQKDWLCERFGLPILRINSRYLEPSYRQMDLLSWFVNYWFAQKTIDDAYQSGDLPSDAYVDPMSFMTLPGTNGCFPLWLAAEVRASFHQYREKGVCLDPGPSSYIGIDEAGAYRAISYMAVTATDGLCVETGMRAQQFPVPISEILDAIAEHQIYEQFVTVIKGNGNLIPLDAIVSHLSRYNRFPLAMSSLGTQSERLRAAAPNYRWK